MALFGAEHPDAGALAAAWLADPEGRLAQLADVLDAYWQRAIAPAWPRIRAFLEADIAHRARLLAEQGAAPLLAGLHPGVAFAGDRLDVTSVHEATVELDGRGLVLVPSAFAWERPATIDLSPWQPTLAYPARGIATLWEQAPATPVALARLLGATRASVLAALDGPCSTTELAQRLEMSPAGVSHHLVTLRDAGLVCGRREGRALLYARTATADALLDGDGRAAPAGG
jgi:DNA-binding transcriptional ArsR family regulator